MKCSQALPARAAFADVDLCGVWLDIDEFDRIDEPNPSDSDPSGRTPPLSVSLPGVRPTGFAGIGGEQHDIRRANMMTFSDMRGTHGRLAAG